MISFKSVAQNGDINSNTSMQVKNENKIHPKRNLIRIGSNRSYFLKIIQFNMKEY